MANEVYQAVLHTATTLISSKFPDMISKEPGTASGFFYSQFLPNAANKIWLITCRHVVMKGISAPANIRIFPDMFTFGLRSMGNGSIQWVLKDIDTTKLRKLTKFHKSPMVDIAAIDVTEFFVETQKTDTAFMDSATVTQCNLPTPQQAEIGITSKIVVASYPKGYYDHLNKFPVVKSGNIASAWKSYFNGEPYFMIDTILFPGSSGGLVISAPLENLGINTMACQPNFVFLGVYCGEFRFGHLNADGKMKDTNPPYPNGMGRVCYSYFVPEIINNGVSYPQGADDYVITKDTDFTIRFEYGKPSYDLNELHSYFN